MPKDPPATLDEPDTDCEVIAKLRAENERLRTFILTLDGKTICIRTDGDMFIDDGIIVASDILSPVT